MDRKSKVIQIINQVIQEDGRNETFNGSPDASLRNDLKFDSLALAKLTVLIEDEFGVDIFEDSFATTAREIYSKLGIE